MGEIRFGPAGIPIDTPGEGTAAGIAYCREIGLSAMEVEFVHGVNMKEEKCREAASAAKKKWHQTFVPRALLHKLLRKGGK